MQPPPFPRSEADLGAWLVYTDWLLTRGDPRGELMALDLALPSAPEREQLQQFHAAARRFCRQSSTASVSWCLGHARAIELWPMPRRTLDLHGGPSSSVLANACEFLRTPAAASLETLSMVPEGKPKLMQRLFSALPATCRRLELVLPRQTWPAQSAKLIDMIPSTIRELTLHFNEFAGPPCEFIDDRFDVVDLAAARLGPWSRHSLAAALARTRVVQLQQGDSVVTGHAECVFITRDTAKHVHDVLAD